MTEIPDIFADRYEISPGRYGLTITFRRTEPSTEPGIEKKSNVVALVRMTPALADELARDIIRRMAEHGNQRAEPAEGA